VKLHFIITKPHITFTLCRLHQQGKKVPPLAALMPAIAQLTFAFAAHFGTPLESTKCIFDLVFAAA
jgi:hypothetical protein